MSAHRPPSQTERITALLRDDILRGRYREGERLPSERDLADRFEVHRGAVREAFKKLEQLGLADIRPGGARAGNVEDASLDIVEYLLELAEPADPRVVEQILEVFSGQLAMAARLGVERADEEERVAARALLEELARPDVTPTRQHDLFHALGHLFIDASHNIVLKLVRRGLKTHLIGRFRAEELVIPHAVRVPLIRRLARTVDTRDGAEAAETMFLLTSEMRRHAIDSLAERHEAIDRAGTGQAGRRR